MAYRPEDLPPSPTKPEAPPAPTPPRANLPTRGLIVETEIERRYRLIREQEKAEQDERDRQERRVRKAPRGPVKITGGERSWMV